MEESLKTQNLSSVSFPYLQATWFITLGYVQWTVTFQAFLIKKQVVIGNLKENEAEIQKIETVTSPGSAHQDLLLRMLLSALNHPFPAS